MHRAGHGAAGRGTAVNRLQKIGQGHNRARAGCQQAAPAPSVKARCQGRRYRRRQTADLTRLNEDGSETVEATTGD